MAIKSKASDVSQVDVVICGGGVGACVTAARLAEADPSLSILVIEQGPDNYEVPTVQRPAFYLSHLQPDSKTAIFYKGNKNKYLADREPIVPAGGTLGGGSSINFMVYVRAPLSDYDTWKTPGWTGKEVLPFMKKFETFHGKASKETHGTSGPINISEGTWKSDYVQAQLLEAAASQGYPIVDDLQDLTCGNGYEKWLHYIGPDGLRQDAAHRYLHPLLRDGKHPNLHVVCEAAVQRVVLDESGTAVAVEYTANPAVHPDAAGTVHTVKARKQVVLASGACGTPNILERSGIGAPAVLSKAGVPVKVDLPGVGENYQDHHIILYFFKTNGNVEAKDTIDDILSQRADAGAMIGANHAKLGWNAIDVMGKLRPTDAEIDALGPEFRKAFDADFKDIPEKAVMLQGYIHGFLGDPSLVPAGEYISGANYTAIPYSRGHMHITGPNVGDPLDFETGFMSDEHQLDVKKHIWAYKQLRDLVRRTKFFAGELALGHPKFPAGSKAAVIDEWDVAAQGTPPPIAYTPEDDKAIEQFVRENVGTTWHSLGTAKMAPREKGGVVDQRLKVHGTKNLRIIDLSIPPENVTANTYNTALLVGERGAAYLVEDLGLGGSGSSSSTGGGGGLLDKITNGIKAL